MALTPGTSTESLFGAASGTTLRMIAYLALACTLMVLDHHLHLLSQARRGGAVLIEPVFALASVPARLSRATREMLASRGRLQGENRALREALLLAEARISRLRALGEQNRRYRDLLDVRGQLSFSVQTARLVGVDLGAYRHRVAINVGARGGAATGMTILDAHGIMGQVVEVGRDMAQVMLITDPEHALPVVDERTGLRLVVRGTGRLDALRIEAIPPSADVRAGDRLASSGLGGRFPAGFPVARIDSVWMDADGMFQVAAARPAADLGRSSEVLLLHEQPEQVGPPPPAPQTGPPRSAEPPAAAAGQTP